MKVFQSLGSDKYFVIIITLLYNGYRAYFYGLIIQITTTLKKVLQTIVLAVSLSHCDAFAGDITACFEAKFKPSKYCVPWRGQYCFGLLALISCSQVKGALILQNA